MGMVIFDPCAPPWPVSLWAINCWLLPACWLMESPCLSFTRSINTAARHLGGSPLMVLINSCLLGLLALRRCARTHRVSPSRWFKPGLQRVSLSCICKILFNTWCISRTCEINAGHKHTEAGPAVGFPSASCFTLPPSFFCSIREQRRIAVGQLKPERYNCIISLS